MKRGYGDLNNKKLHESKDIIKINKTMKRWRKRDRIL